MDNKKLSKRILLKRINGYLKNSIAGVVIIVVLLALVFAGVQMERLWDGKGCTTFFLTTFANRIG